MTCLKLYIKLNDSWVVLPKKWVEHVLWKCSWSRSRWKC